MNYPIFLAIQFLFEFLLPAVVSAFWLLHAASFCYRKHLVEQIVSVFHF